MVKFKKVVFKRPRVYKRSDEFRANHSKFMTIQGVLKRGYIWLATNNNNVSKRVLNMSKFCREENLDQGDLHKTLKNRKQHKGWSLTILKEGVDKLIDGIKKKYKSIFDMIQYKIEKALHASKFIDYQYEKIDEKAQEERERQRRWEIRYDQSSPWFEGPQATFN